jgi:putative ABC transport system permease protein
VRQHTTRTVLTMMGIVIGVAVFVAMHTANRAVMAVFQDTLDRIAGVTELQITAGEAGFDEEVLERVQAVAEVRVAAPVIEAAVGTRLTGQGNLLILGVDMTGDRSLREYDLAAGDEAMLDDPLVFLAQPDSIMISAPFAERNALRLGSRVPLDTIDGAKDFTVRGILRAGGMSQAFGGNLAVMDIYAAQHVFGRGRKFDRIDLALVSGADLPRTQASLQAMLGPGFEVQSPATRGQSFQSLARIYRFMLHFSSAFALIVGMFLIYNAFAIAVAQRRGEIGLLRALGATRGQVWRLFLMESAALAIAGSIIGVFAGQAAAGIAARGTARLLQGVFGLAGSGAVPTGRSLEVALVALAIGIGTSALAAALPARSAARIDPIKALQKGRRQVLGAGSSRGRTITAIVMGAAGIVLLVFTRTMGMFYAGYLCLLLASLLIVPAIALWLTRAIRPLLSAIRPVEGALAADSLIAAPTRTSSTVAALMLSLALVIGIAGIARGSYARIAEWMNTALNPDLFVTSSQSLTERTYKFPDAMTADLEAIPGIAEVQRQRTARIQMGGPGPQQRGRVLIIAAELAKVARRSPRQALQGDLDEMFRLASAGRGAIASENFAALRHARLGDSIDIPSPGGVLRLPIVGVIREYSDQSGALFIDRTLFAERWRDDSVDFFRVYLAPGAAAAQVKEAILTKFAGHRRIFVLSNDDVRRYVMGLTNQWFSMTWAQAAIAILVAILGIVNSLTVSVADRRREFGLLRALGGSRSQVRWTIWMEALGIGVVSLLIGCAMGAVHLYCLLEMTSRDVPGLRFDYLYPYGIALLLVPMILLTALAGALLPAESAARGSLTQALEYE